jgi:mannose-6-phosphate isomerase-like protein (cupin superfamily)
MSDDGSPPKRAFVVGPGEGTTVRGPVGGPTTIWARAEDTGGAFALMEIVIPPLQGPPLHVHNHEDEMWLLPEGRFRFRADDEIFEAPAGAFVFVPRGVRHCFQNIGDEPARIVVMFAPAGMERFFEQHARLPEGPVDPAAYRRIAADNGMEVAGPPLGESDPL